MIPGSDLDSQILWYQGVKASVEDRIRIFEITAPDTDAARGVIAYLHDMLADCDVEIDRLTEQRLALPAERKSHDQEQAAHLRDGA